RVARYHRNAHLVRAKGRYVSLALVAPMHFHARRPRRDLEVAAVGIAPEIAKAVIESGPLPNAGARAVRSNDPSRAQSFGCCGDAILVESGDRSAPTKRDAAGCRARDHLFMENGAAKTERVAAGTVAA